MIQLPLSLIQGYNFIKFNLLDAFDITRDRLVKVAKLLVANITDPFRDQTDIFGL